MYLEVVTKQIVMNTVYIGLEAGSYWVSNFELLWKQLIRIAAVTSIFISSGEFYLLLVQLL